MKSLVVALFTLLFLVVSFVTMTASTDGTVSSGSNTNVSDYSWMPEEVWCYDPFSGNYRIVTQCDQSGGACSDQACPCTGHVIEM
jgi:hypothetical protein